MDSIEYNRIPGKVAIVVAIVGFVAGVLLLPTLPYWILICTIAWVAIMAVFGLIYLFKSARRTVKPANPPGPTPSQQPPLTLTSQATPPPPPVKTVTTTPPPQSAPRPMYPDLEARIARLEKTRAIAMMWAAVSFIIAALACLLAAAAFSREFRVFLSE